MTVQEKLYTADDLLKMPRGKDGTRYELVRGELAAMSPTGDTHGIICVELILLIGNYAGAHDLGRVIGTDTGFTLFTDPDTVRAPDVAFITKARMTPLTGKFFHVAPDLAVEVISPSETASAINDKIVEYFEAGVKLVWIVYPKTRTIHVYTASDEVHILKSDNVLNGGDVLPGFSVPVNDIFKMLNA